MVATVTAEMEANETILNSLSNPKKTIIGMTPMIQPLVSLRKESANKYPAAVDTALPPLNLANNG